MNRPISSGGDEQGDFHSTGIAEALEIVELLA